MRIPRRPKDVLCLDRHIEMVEYLSDKLEIYFDNEVSSDDLEIFCLNYVVKLRKHLGDNRFESFWAEPLCCLNTQIEGKCIVINFKEPLIEPGVRIYFYTLMHDLTYGTDFDVSEERDMPQPKETDPEYPFFGSTPITQIHLLMREETENIRRERIDKEKSEKRKFIYPVK